MIFDSIIGNSEVKRALMGMVDNGRVPHAIMFYENDGCGAIEIATGFLEYLMKSGKVARYIHPDIQFVFPVTKGSKVSADKPTSEHYLSYWRELLNGNPFFLENDLSVAFGIEGKSSVIAVQEAKAILDRLSLSALEGGYKAVVVYQPEKMNAETANRLLKSIEEPPEKTQFIFITHSPEKVLTTISSRCQGVRILPLSKDEVAQVLVERFGKTEEQAAAAAAMAGGSVGKALEYLSESEDSAAEAALFRTLMDALVSKNLSAVLDAGEAMAALSSREKTKSFCVYMSEAFRKIFMIQQGLPQIASLTEDEERLYATYAVKLKKSFVRNALPLLDRSYMLIDRNVNARILFCDMVDKLFMMM